MTVWTHELLDALRQVGDPALDATGGQGGWRDVAVAPAGGVPPAVASPEAPTATVPPEVELLQAWRRSPTGALPAVGEALRDPFWCDPGDAVDPERVAVAQDLFIVYGGEIAAALLLASLPNAYAAEAGAGVLAATDELRSNTRRRIAETAQVLVDVLLPDPTPLYDPVTNRPGGWRPDAARTLQPGGRGYVSIRSTRLTHAVIRELVTARGTWDPDEPVRNRMEHRGIAVATRRGVPINQEDLLGTLGTFTVTVFDVMQKLGVAWSADAEAAYLALWDRVGELLGIGTPEVTDELAARGIELPPQYVGRLRPTDPADARRLFDLVRDRLWPVPDAANAPTPFAAADGKLLVRALLDELQSAMPTGLERVPLKVMRHLVHEDAAAVLGLGGGGLPDSLLRWPRLRPLPGRSPWHLGRVGFGWFLRFWANEVSRRAFLRFIRVRAIDESQADFRFAAVPREYTVIDEGRRSG